MTLYSTKRPALILLAAALTVVSSLPAASRDPLADFDLGPAVVNQAQAPAPSVTKLRHQLTTLQLAGLTVALNTRLSGADLPLPANTADEAALAGWRAAAAQNDTDIVTHFGRLQQLDALTSAEAWLYYGARGRSGAGDAALAEAAAPTGIVADLLAARTAQSAGRREPMLTHARNAASAATEIQSPGLRLHAALALSLALAMNGLPVEGLLLAEDARRQARELGTPALELEATLRASSLAIDVRRMDLAVTRAGEARALAVALSDRVLTARATNIRAIAQDELGQRREARLGYQEYVEGILAAGNEGQKAFALHNLGYFDAQAGRITDARRTLQLGLEHAAKGNVTAARPFLLLALSLTERTAGNADTAIAQAREAFAALKAEGSSEGVLFSGDKLVSALLSAGRTTEAAQAAAEVDAAAPAGSVWTRARGDYSVGRSRLLLAQSDHAATIAFATDLLGRFERERYDLNATLTRNVLAQAQLAAGQAGAARATATHALDRARALDVIEPEWRARWTLARLEPDATRRAAALAEVIRQAETLGLGGLLADIKATPAS